MQNVFIFIMKDPKSKQFSRESCCLGFAACRRLVKLINDKDLTHGLSADEFNNRLFSAFGQTTNFGSSAMMETPAQAAARRAAEGIDRGREVADVVDREVGGASGMGEAALGAYREMAAASVALQRSDIMYALLFLSVSHPYWLSESSKLQYRYVHRCTCHITWNTDVSEIF